MNEFLGIYICKIGPLHCISKDLSYNCRQMFGYYLILDYIAEWQGWESAELAEKTSFSSFS